MLSRKHPLQLCVGKGIHALLNPANKLPADITGEGRFRNDMRIQEALPDFVEGVPRRPDLFTGDDAVDERLRKCGHIAGPDGVLAVPQAGDNTCDVRGEVYEAAADGPGHRAQIVAGEVSAQLRCRRFPAFLRRPGGGEPRRLTKAM